MRFGVLGTVVMWHEGREISLSSTHQLTVSATLLLQHNRVVPLEKLIDALWDFRAAADRPQRRPGLRLTPAHAARAGPGNPDHAPASGSRSGNTCRTP